MTEQNVKYLVQQFFRNECTPQEREELMSWITQSADDAALKKLLEEAWKQFEPLYTIPADSADSILSSILSPAEAEPVDYFEVPVKTTWWKRLSVAAILLLLIGTGSYLLLRRDARQDLVTVNKTTVAKRNTGDPGRKAAMLTLSNGSTIVLDSLFEGSLAEQGKTQVINRKGELVYQGNENGSSTLLYNTLSTQRGELYPLNLSDGSRVWLNSSSSILYPVAFHGPERVVELHGEAYFEVAKNPLKPFKVICNGTEIQVLGTHFNLNAYADEPTIKTTLVEGSLKVTKGGASVLLAPGQQADIKENGKIELLKNVNIEQVVSWTNGYFQFDQVELKAVMRQLSRWYDVDVVYENKNPGHFGGSIPKSANLSEVQRILNRSEFHTRIEGRKLIVLD